MNLDNFSYHMPTKVVYGQNSLEKIDEFIKGRKTLLVTSQGFVRRGLINKINSYTDNVVKVISNVKSHPEFKDLEQIYNYARKTHFELILAIGGGSVIDAAKFISVYNENFDYRFVEGLARGTAPKSGYNLCPIISVPTTAGTGSEITPYSTIWDMYEQKKYSLQLPGLFCELALYDSVLTLTAPRSVTIQTGLDTLSHALESIWNKNASPITIDYAVKSAKLVVDNLVELSNNLDSIQLRDNMMRACMYAGFSFSNTQTAIAHAMSYYITAHKDIEHGIACSFTLPILIDNVAGKFNFVDDALIRIFGELSSDKLRVIMRELDVSTNFSDYGIEPNELDEIVSKIITNSRADNSLVSF